MSSTGAFRGKSVSDDLIVMDEVSTLAIAQSISTPSMTIRATDSTPLLTVHPDGRWEVDPERAPEAAKIFLEEVANLTQALNDLIDQRNRIVEFIKARLDEDEREIWASHRDYDPSWGLVVHGSDPQASHGSQDPNGPGGRESGAQRRREHDPTPHPTEEKS